MRKSLLKPPKLSPTQWPNGPLLELPSGELRNYGCGRILTADHFVLFVGLSPQHYLAVNHAPGAGLVGSVMDQAIGFLFAHGAVVVRTDLRAPLMWFAEHNGDFSWTKCLVFFARTFLASDPTDRPWIPPAIRPVCPLETIAFGGLCHWQKVNAMMEGIEAADSELLAELGSSLAAMARRWEWFIARMVILSQRADQYGAGDREMLFACDRLLLSIMTRFGRGYELLPATTMRLL